MKPFLEKIYKPPDAPWSMLNRRLRDGIPFQWHHSHVEPAKAFLEAGFHVVCDKPLALCVEEAERLASWRTNPAESGVGGAVGDIGTHALNLLEYVTGEQVTALCADTATFLPDRTATTPTRVPPGLPEGYLEAFANLYRGIVEAIRRHIEGKPLQPSEYGFPTVRDGLRGMQFIEKTVRSAAAGGSWIVL